MHASLIFALSRINGMEWNGGMKHWNRILKWVNCSLMPKLSYFINTWINDEIYQQRLVPISKKGQKYVILSLATTIYPEIFVLCNFYGFSSYLSYREILLLENLGSMSIIH